MITREEVIWLYRCFFNRYPESEDIIQKGMLTHHSFQTARISCIMAREFQDIWIPSPYYEPPRTEVGFEKNPAQTLAIACIVKNEERNIRDMIMSCIPVADEFVLVDTGSEDATVNIATECLQSFSVRYDIKQISFSDFSHARNHALQSVSSHINWVLMLDADERLVQEDYQKLINLLLTSRDGWRLPRYNFRDFQKKEKPSPYPDFQARLFRNRPDNPVIYKGTVHEQPIGVEAWEIAPVSTVHYQGDSGGPHIHHFGLVDQGLEKSSAKTLLYNQLIAKKNPWE